MAKIKVYPTSKTSMVLNHPIDGKLKSAGSEWEQDGFTARMITDGACTVDKGKGWVDDTPPLDPSKLPAHATTDEEKPDEPDVAVDDSGTGRGAEAQSFRSTT